MYRSTCAYPAPPADPRGAPSRNRSSPPSASISAQNAFGSDGRLLGGQWLENDLIADLAYPHFFAGQAKLLRQANGLAAACTNILAIAVMKVSFLQVWGDVSRGRRDVASKPSRTPQSRNPRGESHPRRGARHAATLRDRFSNGSKLTVSPTLLTRTSLPGNRNSFGSSWMAGKSPAMTENDMEISS
jgi:hypothetical protein